MRYLLVCCDLYSVDPVLFTGTVRSNLDPFSFATDGDVWEALRRVRMRDTVAGLDGQLDANVDENGVNFSVGCVAVTWNLMRSIEREHFFCLIPFGPLTVVSQTTATDVPCACPHQARPCPRS